MFRVLFSSKQLAGHIFPLLPFARCFEEQGSEVLFAAATGADKILERVGLPHAEFDCPSESELKNIWNLALEDTSVDLLTGAGRLLVDLNVRKGLPRLRNIIAGWKPDLIVRESSEFAAKLVAVEAGIPSVRISINNLRAETEMVRLAMPLMKEWQDRSDMHQSKQGTLISEPSFTYFPITFDSPLESSEMQEPTRVRSDTEGIEPNPPIPDWYGDAELPLVFITFGTRAAKLQSNYGVLRSVLEAVEASPVRALFSAGGDLDLELLGAIPKNVCVRNWAARAEVFPRINAMICHGGSGTIIAGLSHGVPMIIIPLAADQPENAKLVEDSGTGIYVKEPDKPTVQSAIREILTNKRIVDSVTKLAQEIAAMQTINHTVSDLINKYEKPVTQ